MSADASQPETRVPGRPFELPRLVDIAIRTVLSEPPQYRYYASELGKFTEAIEFRVQTDRPMNLSMALTPVLFVGDTMLMEGEQLDETVYTFLAFKGDTLEPGAAISLAYPGTPTEARPESKFRYEPPKGS
jgi:hypothetical protein